MFTIGIASFVHPLLKSSPDIFIDSKKAEIEKRLKKRVNFNRKLINKFKKIQFSSVYKKRKSNFIIKNNFEKKSLNKSIKKILNEIL